MGFKRDIAGLVSLAINLTGDLSPDVTYRRHNGSVYDVKLGKPVASFTDYGPVKATLARFSAAEKDDSINVLTDQKALIAMLDLQRLGYPAGAEPNENDELIIGTVRWDVRRALGVPGESLLILQIRKI